MSPSPLILIPREPEPVLRCRICKTSFPEVQRSAFEHHVIKCFERNEAEVLVESPQRKAPFFFSHVDPEWEIHNQALREKGLDPEVQYKRPKKSAKRASES